MTITTTNNRVNQTADGVQNTFPFDFLVQDASHMRVYEDGVITTKSYTVNGIGNPAGGNVVFSPTVPANGITVTLQRVVPLTQQVDYRPFDPFPADTHEGALDKLTQITQQNADEVERALKGGVATPPGTSYELPFPERNRGLYWEDTATPTRIVNGPTIAEVEANKNAAEAAANAAQASAANAASSETNAGNSASAASTSETNAANSASAASTSETNAANSAAAAAQSAADAERWSQHDIAGGFFFSPEPSTTVTRFVCASPFRLPINLTGSQGVCRDNPTAVTALDIQKNEVSVGSISIATDGTVTFTMAAEQSFAAGDVLEVITPAAVNALSQTAYTLKGSLV